MNELPPLRRMPCHLDMPLLRKVFRPGIVTKKLPAEFPHEKLWGEVRP